MFPSRRGLKYLAFGAPLWLLWPLIPLGWVPACLYLVAWCGLCLYDLRSLPKASDFVCERRVPPRFSYQDPCSLELELTSHGRTSMRIELEDSLPDALQQLERIRAFDLEPDQSANILYRVLPVTRGIYEFGPLYLRIQSQRGLMHRQFRLSCPGEARVYPSFVQVADYELLAKLDERETALRKSRTLRGQGSDFESLRPYLPGEDLRFVDWKSSAKRGSLISRNYQVEKGQTLAVLVDAGRFMNERIGIQSRFEHALYATSMLAYVAQRRGDAMAVATFNNQIESFLPPVKGPRLMGDVLESVYCVQSRKVESDYWSVMAQAMARLKKRSLIIMLTDVLDPAASSGLFSNLARAARKHLVLCVVFVEQEIDRLATSKAQDAQGTWVKAAAANFAVQRRIALEKMKARGILVLETPPESFTPDLIRKYLEIRKADLQ